ncbi:glycosyltransferase family 4 protein [Microbacterium thalassium]|uniref:Glycosyltransferase involved in cell wall biosynthesis n=1 Tax=Microbacterium thalassium TaxID=362649 RepID=A0A7X0FLT0_9MICO|nr:glycosyltransferase [Microbacterium thalassium]MBB6389885.1 glycosyltransferase involved in cell wall biosynthesis [Microbacterium thalassium]GLK24572.1 hypothetical protein GCM10017607_18900 [Microbacterium thalassium]
MTAPLRIVQIAPHIAAGSGIAGVAYELERQFIAAGASVERFTFDEALGRAVDPTTRTRLAHAWDVVWFSTVGSRRAKRHLALRPDAVSICHNDAMAGDVYVNHGLLQTAMRARGNYAWRMVRNPVHLFTAARDRIRYRGHTHRAVVTLSDEESRRLIEIYDRVAAPITVIPNGVDLDRFRPPTDAERAQARAAMGLAADDRLAVFIGHEFDRKGLPLVLEAMRGIDRLRLVVVGGTPDAVAAGRRLAAQYDAAERVTFAGTVADPVPHLWAGDLFVLPSAYESSGLVFLEALASGLPIVATRAGVAPERIDDGVNGFLVDRTATDVERGIREVLALDHGTARVRARESVADLGWPGIAARYLDLARTLARDTASGPLRILHAVRSDGFSGVERFILQLALAQSAAGHTVSIAGGTPDRMREVLAGSGIRHRAARTTLEVARAIRDMRHDVDVVNTHMTAADLAATIALGATRRRPAVVSTRHFARQRGSIGPVPYDRMVRSVVDRELSISDAVARAAGVPSTVVHTGLPDADAIATAGESRRILMAQRLQPEKAAAVGLRVFAASGLAANGWELMIAGDGPERDRLGRQARELGIDGAVTFLGYRTDVPELMTTSDILLAPCPIEGLGLTVLEAMRDGLPVVAARGGGHVELLEGLDPRALFTPGDAAAGGRALRALADDPQGRAALALAARDRQRAAFTLDVQRERTDVVYRAAIAARRGTHGDGP